MHIIFGDAASVIADKYTVLELDTFKIPSKDKTLQAFCVVAQPPMEELANLDHYKKMHNSLVESYRAKKWDICEAMIQVLKGRWGGEVDTFYEDMLQRVIYFRNNPPPEDWDWTILKEEQA